MLTNTTLRPCLDECGDLEHLRARIPLTQPCGPWASGLASARLAIRHRCHWDPLPKKQKLILNPHPSPSQDRCPAGHSIKSQPYLQHWPCQHEQAVLIQASMPPKHTWTAANPMEHKFKQLISPSSDSCAQEGCIMQHRTPLQQPQWKVPQQIGM